MSDARSQRSGAGNDRHTVTMWVGTASTPTGMSTRRTAISVNRASATVTARPRWTPPRTPYAAMASPPSVGAMAIGMRRRIDCTVKTRACRSLGSASASPSVADPSPRVLVDAVEQVLRAPEQADRGDGRPERLQVLRQEALPEILTQREQEDGRRDGEEVAHPLSSCPREIEAGTC